MTADDGPGRPGATFIPGSAFGGRSGPDPAPGAPRDETAGSVDPEFQALLEHLRDARGFDFTGYKEASLQRRVQRRMAQVDAPTYSDYLDLLQVRPEEFADLFDVILINVTSFFRDPAAWEHLRSRVLPDLLARRASGPVRVWSAGCASGEEAYTLAMIFAEELGLEQARERVKIYATDVDGPSLAHARLALYDAGAVASVPPDLLERYFEQLPDGRHSFRKELRRAVIFGRNDLVQDAPISRVDLLVCRNTLMYFNAETQARILRRFEFSLAESSVLMLGKAETLLRHGASFTPIDLRSRLFSKDPGGSLPLARPQHPPTADGAHTPDLSDALAKGALGAGPSAQIVLDPAGLVVLTNARANHMFGLSARDWTRPFRDLEVSYRPVELRSAVETAVRERRTVAVEGVEWAGTLPEPMWLDVAVTPLEDPARVLVGVSLTFTDVTRYSRLREQLQVVNSQLETAYEELQSSNEELETTNEELQSTVEELETTNEELQSTNEELETMNEELSSTNDEMQTINDGLETRTTELDGLSSFMDSVLASLSSAVIVVGSDMRVSVWNRRAEELWGLRREETVGQHLLDLDFGLSADVLRPTIRGVLSGAGEGGILEVTAVNRRGRTIDLRVTASPLPDRAGGVVVGAILAMDVMAARDPAGVPDPAAD